MTIEKIEHNPGASKATVTLNYKDIRDINNALCKDENISELHRYFFLLFEIVKNGCIDRFTIEHLSELLKMEDAANAEESKT